MTATPPSAHIAVTALAVSAFILVVFFPTLETPEPAEGDPLVTLVLEDVGPDETCSETFHVDGHYDRMSLNYRFGTAIKPRIALEEPDGTPRPARTVGPDLVLDIEAPTPGEWTLNVWVDRSPGVATGIRDGTVFMLGFPPQEDREPRGSFLCSGTLSQS